MPHAGSREAVRAASWITVKTLGSHDCSFLVEGPDISIQGPMKSRLMAEEQTGAPLPAVVRNPGHLHQTNQMAQLRVQSRQLNAQRTVPEFRFKSVSYVTFLHGIP